MSDSDLQLNISFPVTLDRSTTIRVATMYHRHVVSDELYKDLLLLWPLVWAMILPPGLIANALNIRTFFRMKLDDSVTISFFVLAISDFSHLLYPLGNIVAVFLMYLEENYAMFFSVQPMALYVYIVNVAVAFNNWTSLITAFLAIQRCLCVFLPFHFKAMFTNARTWCVMAVLGVISVVPAASIIAAYDMMRMQLPDNKTQYVIVVTPLHAYVQRYMDTILFAFINTACLVISFGSLIVMSHSLAASVRFRKEIATRANQPSSVSGSASNDTEKSKQGVEGGKQTFNSKERTAIVQVGLLSFIYLLTNLPKFLIALVAASEPEFSVVGAYRNIYMIFINVRVTFDYLNSAVNFLVYYRYNTRFKKLCFASGNDKKF